MRSIPLTIFAPSTVAAVVQTARLTELFVDVCSPRSLSEGGVAVQLLLTSFLQIVQGSEGPLSSSRDL